MRLMTLGVVVPVLRPISCRSSSAWFHAEYIVHIEDGFESSLGGPTVNHLLLSPYSD